MKYALALGISVLGCPSLAFAHGPPSNDVVEPQAPSPSGVHVVDDDTPPPPAAPRAKDLLGGHVLVGGSVGPAWSLGKLASDVAAVRGLGTGLTLQADAGLGFSRTVVLGAWANYTRYRDGDRCGVASSSEGCSAYSLAVGPFVRYHLSQGLRFDPWVLLGAGYRRVRYDEGVTNPLRASSELTESRTYSGLSWLRLELGADYYLWSGIGLGPFGALSLSSYTDRPSTTGDAAVNTELSFGLRVLLDVPGR